MLQQPSIACYDAINNASQLKIVYTRPNLLCVYLCIAIGIYGWKCVGEIKMKPCMGISLEGWLKK